MKRFRPRLTSSGKLWAAVLASSATAMLVVKHPAPALGAAFLAAAFLLSLVAAGYLRRVQVGVLPPGRILEGDSAVLNLELGSPSYLPVLPLRLRLDAVEFRAPEQDQLLVPRETRHVPLRIEGLERGHARGGVLRLECSSPFQLLRHRREVPVLCDLWVLPAPRTLRERVLEELLTLRPRGLDLPQPTGPGDGEFYTLREFREGDSERRVHHRVSARMGKKMLRLFRGEAPPRVLLILDLRVALRARTFERADFEEAVRFAAGIVRSLFLRGVPVELAFLGRSGVEPAVAPGCRELLPYLSALAVVKPLPVSGAPAMPDLSLDGEDGRRVLVHLGMVNEQLLPPRWIAIQAGSQRYFQLLEPRYHRTGAGVAR